ncbi:MAG: hypothetical protein ORN56_00965 [Chitinophagales bacterium]|nr:hypothetical protein [Chitinophagales bacterium]
MKRFLKYFNRDAVHPALAKIILYEYWPVWVVYFPAFFYWLYLSLRARTFTYFITTNPGLENGGAFGGSKEIILSKIAEDYKPRTMHVNASMDYSQFLEIFNESTFLFPIICKPDEGERGYRVKKVFSFDELESYFQTSNNTFIIQDYINYPEEYGVLFYRYPSGKTGITSLTTKRFLSVTGDGTSTVEQLLKKSTRARMQINRLLNERPNLLKHIPADTEKIVVEPIGNHCKGTEFINCCHLINEQLIETFDKITKPINGFYYGRFDLKVTSLEDLYQGKNIKIMELNGTNSEAIHIYSKEMNIVKAYKAIFHNMKIVFEIAMENKSKGVKSPSVFLVAKKVRRYFKLREKN